MRAEPVRPVPLARYLPIERPTLHLSGPKLATAFESLAAEAEQAGGLERLVDALGLKFRHFQSLLGEGRAREVSLADFRTLCAWMSTVRRRIGPWLEPGRFETLRGEAAALLDGPAAAVDARIDAFCAAFPGDRRHRWVRDLAAELLHHVDPERYPLMCRWVWDESTNTGLLREVWHGEDVDHHPIEVPSRHETFVVLREELAGYLSGQGVYRDVMMYVDLLCAQVYARYIEEQGGTYLRTDFASAPEPMAHARRLLGLDAVTGDGRLRVKAADGRAVLLEDPRLPEA